MIENSTNPKDAVVTDNDQLNETQNVSHENSDEKQESETNQESGTPEKENVNTTEDVKDDLSINDSTPETVEAVTNVTESADEKSEVETSVSDEEPEKNEPEEEQTVTDPEKAEADNAKAGEETQETESKEQNDKAQEHPQTSEVNDSAEKDVVTKEPEEKEKSSADDSDEENTSFEGENFEDQNSYVGDDEEEDDEEDDEEDTGDSFDDEATSEDDAEEVDFSDLSKPELVAKLKELLEAKSVRQLKDSVENIKVNFYRLHNAQVLEQRKKFIDGGGAFQDFKPEPDELETEFKELLKLYREKKAEYIQNIENEKEENLKARYQIIDELKELVNKKESINKTFQEFKEIQNRWRSIGNIAQTEVKNVWGTYNHHVEKFYDYIKINKELRDLDFKRNLEAKIKLCERAEELLLEPSIVSAFKMLQKYHAQWREIGPVPMEQREEIWARFKEATSTINKNHHEYFEKLKQERENNLKAKILLCEKAEDLCQGKNTSYKDWEEKSKQLIELQKIWRLIGFAPKKDNNKVYKRFRTACDDFFAKKREFYAKKREEQENNLELKTELCLQAEGMKDSTDWKKTTQEYIKIQKQWKEIGPVPRKHSDAIWERFRTTCNYFFDKKAEFFNNRDKTQDENLKKKQDLIERINGFTPGEDNDQNLEQLKSFQKEWTDIGFVPYKNKDEIQKQYRAALNKHFKQLDLDEFQKSELRFKNKLKNMQHSPKSQTKMRREREKLVTKLEQVESDISLWENNIGFFAKSENAQSLIEDVNKKIENARKTADSLRERLGMMDKLSE